MDSQSRQTASTYINNLLLSRGLLRNGSPIEFARPGQVEGGLDATMSQIMSLVHDLILRRDRESDTLSTLSQNVSTLRTKASTDSQLILRLEGEKVALERQLALSSAQERSTQATVRSAESRNRALREEMTRLKGTVAQIRAQCTADVRRRDTEAARLKKHLEGRRGREGVAGGHAGVIIINPGAGKAHTAMAASADTGDAEHSSPDSLKQETTEFLTRLSQSLSEENDALIGLVRSTLATLRTLQGLPENACSDEGGNDNIDDAKNLMNGPPSYEELATSTDEVLEHLRGLLTNPSFVPLEEVVIREEEIQRLRDGWEKMAVRWREAVAMMDGWKKRIVDEGDTINLEDVKSGLKLGNGIPTAQEARPSPLRAQIAAPNPDSSAVRQDDSTDLLNVSIDSLEGTTSMNGVAPNTKVMERVLKETSANTQPTQSPRKKAIIVSIPEDEIAPEADDGLLDERPQESESLSSPIRNNKSRIPLQVTAKQPIPTIEEKLELAQAEAEAVRHRAAKKSRNPAPSKSSRSSKPKGSRRRSTLSPEELENLMGAP